MRVEYRIKVEETYGGKKSYIPQIGEVKLTICKRSCYPWIKWRNLWVYNALGDVQPSNTYPARYDSEEKALAIINRYKEQLSDTQSKEVKSTTFIAIN
jgi:hypothetical protein